MSVYSLLLIKPNATQKHHIGDIITMVEHHGFELVEARIFTMTRDLAESFYEMHKGKPFFESLVHFMTSGRTTAVILQKQNAVEDLRKLIGDTDPSKQEWGTIRKLYADNITENAVHASDSDESAKREIGILFPYFKFMA
ncbi:MAG TPA: nucleoside-diphosphate kinase [Candidatus Cloacimonadota bacterium]|nr:nucleoside-diphosphate kinase [Candidatus Cloacimonadota bacterium]HPT72965.1 nucleoside-diphosphate kinase [Candidatus Cloacimonadota bacterium]